jgi:vitamin B12 transporter
MQKIICFSFVSAFISAVIPSVLWADPPVVEPVGNTLAIESSANTLPAQSFLALPEVVITANRLDTPVSQVTDSMTVITAKDIEQKQESTVMDTLQGVPGLDVVQSGQPGQTSSVYIRGTDSENTLVLMDGIPLNDPIGTPSSYDYLDGLSLDDVKQVEVVRGPQSTLWGSNAAGGVINIVPQEGPSPLGGSVLVEGGSYRTLREVVGAQGGDNGGYFSFNASHFNTAGFPILNVKGLDSTDSNSYSNLSSEGSLDNGDDNNTGSLRLGSNLTSNLQENVFIRYSQSNTSLDAYNSSFVLADDPDYFALQKQFMADSHTNWKLLDGSWEQLMNISFADDNRIYTGVANPYNTYYENGNYDGQTAQINWQNNIHLTKEEKLVLGIQGQEQWVIEADASGYTDLGPNPPDSVPVTSVRTGSGFAESQTSIEDRFFFNLGGRWEDHSQYGVHTTYQAGLAYFVPVLDTKIKANYGTGFVAPSLYQLYDPNYGNPQLSPETSLGYDFGFEQPIGGKDSLNFGADYFDDDLDNLISYNSQFVSVNIGKARTYGVETFIEFKGIRNLNVKGSYTYTHAQDLITDTPLIRRPQNKASGDVDYQWGALGLGTSLTYVGTSLDDDFAGNSVTLPSYFLADLRVSYRVNSQVRLFARVDNLFNRWYEEAYGYNTPGLSAYGGTKISF